MFTGIIEELGTVRAVQKRTQSIVLQIESKIITEDLSIGDSIAVNGVCLTVIDFNTSSFTVDVMPETFKSTTISKAVVGSHVNLERAMSANGRFGGHIVSGHVDCVGKIIQEKRVENARYVTISVPKYCIHYCIHKGSITLDGTSLTLFEVGTDYVVVSLIPHTEKISLLGSKKRGDIVNIEFDVVGKYVESLLNKGKSGTITNEFLTTNGF